MNDFKVLAIHHIGDEPDHSSRISIAGTHVKFVASRDVNFEGRNLKEITVHFMDGDVQAFRISSLDLVTLEEVVSSYS